MFKIYGFGKAEWSAMDSQVAVQLHPSGVHFVISPSLKSLSGTWPTSVKTRLPEGRDVSIELLCDVVPNLRFVVWNAVPKIGVASVECFAVVGDFKVSVRASDLKWRSPNQDRKQREYNQLREIGDALIEMSRDKYGVEIGEDEARELAKSPMELMQRIASIREEIAVLNNKFSLAFPALIE